MNINYAVVSAFERAKAEEPARVSSNHLFTALLLALFFVVLLVCLAMGVRVYGVVSQAQAASDAQHVHTGLVANIVHMNDNADALSRGQGPEGPALVMTETLDTGSYETRVYGYGGMVVQEYAIAGRDYNPQGAVPLFESRSFDFAFDGNLLTVVTDAGQLDVALRSQQDAGLGGPAGEASADAGDGPAPDAGGEPAPNTGDAPAPASAANHAPGGGA